MELAATSKTRLLLVSAVATKAPTEVVCMLCGQIDILFPNNDDATRNMVSA
jgi:hypothetical protein